MATGRSEEEQEEINQNLYSAADRGDSAAVLSHIRDGADINYKDDSGLTPLIIAAANDHQSIVSILLSKEADTNIQDTEGVTALHCAAACGHDAVVHQLLSAGADSTITTNWGVTALDIAKRNGRVTVMNTIQSYSAYIRGMSEGHVYLTSKKLVLMGPPCVGKTAFKSLLFNWSAPRWHHSTSIGARSVRAMERITDSSGGKEWDLVESAEVLSMLSDAIEANEREPSDPQSPVSVSLDMPDTSSTAAAAVTIATGSSTVPEPVEGYDDTPRAKPTLPTSDYSRSITDQLQKKKKGRKSKVLELHKATWIHVLDSGGQPQFADVSRTFLRGNALNVIVIKLTELLSDKPRFAYSLNGEMINAPSELAMTNIQLIEHFVRSVAASKSTTVRIGDKKIVTKPFFIVIGTYFDHAMKGFFSKREVLSETIADKNRQILSVLDEFRDHLIFYNNASDELIFPVDNLCWFNRKKISAQIRERIMSQEGVGFNVPIPVRWYMFELHMREMASSAEHGIISLQSCYDIGANLKMDRGDVKASLAYLDSLTSCLYYDKLLPGTIFTDPQYLLDLLSNIIRVSFVTELDQILPEGQSLSPDTQRLLCKDGVFDESLLDTLGLPFVPFLFTKDDFLKLLQYIRVVAPLHSSDSVQRYYLPIALSPDQFLLTEDSRSVFTATCEPVIIEFKMKLVPQGVFPSLVVSLVGRNKSPFFFIDSRSPVFPRQLRYAVKLYSDDLVGSVLLIDRFKYIEVYFTGFPEGCRALFGAIQEAVVSCGQLLGYNEIQLQTDVALLCQRDHLMTSTAHSVKVTCHNGQYYGSCTSETELAPLLLTEKQLCWLPLIADASVPAILTESHCLPDDCRLNETHAPLILKTISDLHEWEELGIHLRLQNSVIQEIKINNFFQVQTCRKDMIIKWLQGGTATRRELIFALSIVERNDILAKVQLLPTH